MTALARISWILHTRNVYMIGYDPTMRRSESNTKTIHFGGEAAVETAELSGKAENVLNSPQLWESCLKFERCLRSPKLFDFKFNRRLLSTTTARNPPACDIFFNKNYSYPRVIRINYAEIPPLFWWDRSPAICQNLDHFLLDGHALSLRAALRLLQFSLYLSSHKCYE